MKQTASAAMNAVIWLRVRHEAQTPTPARPAPSSSEPTYWATIGPHCRSAPTARASGIGRVQSSATPEEEHGAEVLAQQQLELGERLREDDLEQTGPRVLRQAPHGDGGHEEQVEPRQEIEHRPERCRAREERLPEEQERIGDDEDDQQHIAGRRVEHRLELSPSYGPDPPSCGLPGSGELAEQIFQAPGFLMQFVQESIPWMRPA